MVVRVCNQSFHASYAHSYISLFFGILVGYFTLLHSYHFEIVLYPFEYGLVVIVGFMLSGIY